MEILGIGIDLVDISKLNEKLAKRFLTPKELEIYNNLQGKRKLEFFGGRLAAKEAIFKALPDNDLHYSELEVLYDNFYKPICHYKDYIIHVSITHEDNKALAFAIVEKNH